ncbi:hypothetical protein IAT40_003511 [Kwoniella sp. CBS 6097]
MEADEPSGAHPVLDTASQTENTSSGAQDASSLAPPPSRMTSGPSPSVSRSENRSPDSHQPPKTSSEGSKASERQPDVDAAISTNQSPSMEDTNSRGPLNAEELAHKLEAIDLSTDPTAHRTTTPSWSPPTRSAGPLSPEPSDSELEDGSQNFLPFMPSVPYVHDTGYWASNEADDFESLNRAASPPTELLPLALAQDLQGSSARMGTEWTKVPMLPMSARPGRSDSQETFATPGSKEFTPLFGPSRQNSVSVIPQSRQGSVNVNQPPIISRTGSGFPWGSNRPGSPQNMQTRSMSQVMSQFSEQSADDGAVSGSPRMVNSPGPMDESRPPM